jgi:hypothetical protein
MRDDGTIDKLSHRRLGVGYQVSSEITQAE